MAINFFHGEHNKTSRYSEDHRFHPIQSFYNVIDNIVKGWHNPEHLEHKSEYDFIMPQCDFFETDNAYVLFLELPGVQKNNVDLSVRNKNLLVVKAQKYHHEDKYDKKSRKYHHIERSEGSFYRSITLPDDCDTNKIKAAFANGTLEIVIDKSSVHEAKDVKKITIA